MRRVKRTFSVCSVIAIVGAASGGEAVTAVERFIVPQAMAAISRPNVFPGQFEAEDFNQGGEGVGYHDNEPGNAGGEYRLSEDVDIRSSRGKDRGDFVVTNFETGEWLAYKIHVEQCGNYEIALQVASRFSDSAFRIEIDGQDVTGPVSVPDTGNWNNFVWVTTRRVNLSAGEHLMKVIADRQYFDLNAISGTAVGGTSGGTPYSLHTLPGTVEAEDFDWGGEGVAYHDNRRGNAGGQYRTSDDVDIVNSFDDLGGQFDVNNFETGEWLAYTVEADNCGQYDIALRVSSRFTDSSFHIEVDGQDVTGPVTVPDTGSWTTYQWVTAPTVSLSSGRHEIRVVADRQYFNLNRIRGSIAGTAPPPGEPPPDPGETTFYCSFDNSPTDCGFREQAKEPGRATLVSIARDGSTGVRLHTKVGDNNVAGSGRMERNDLWINPTVTGCPTGGACEGVEQWWAHSIYLPGDFQLPRWHNYVLADFHNSDPGSGQANFHVAFERQSDPQAPGRLAFVGYGGPVVTGGRYSAIIGLPVLNQWYDFVYHVRWSSGSDGFFDAWVNGEQVLSHRGPTLYTGQGVYLKLANYHVPVCDPYPGCIGTHQPSSVIHDRVRRGTSAMAVARGPLEGVLEIVDGQLVPVNQ